MDIKKIFFGNNSGKNIFIRLAYFFAILLLGFYLFSWFGLGFGCALGSSSAFDCRVILPILPIAFVVGIFSIFFLKNNNAYVKKIFLIIFWISVLLPLFLSIFYYSFPNHLQWKYFEGKPVAQSCDTGKWHIYWEEKNNALDDSVCHSSFDICKQLEGDDSVLWSCFRREDYVFKSYEECSLFTKEYLGNCNAVVAKNNLDINYCKDKNTARDVHECLIDIDAQSKEIRKITDIKPPISFGKLISECELMSGDTKDICLSDITYLYGQNVCNYISNDWIRDNCQQID